MVHGPASFFRSNIDVGGKVLGSGGCNSWSGRVAEDGSLGKGIFNLIVGQIKKLKNSPLDWSINLLLFLVVELMPQECAVQVWGLEFMEGKGGRRWQVRGISYRKIIDGKKSRYSPLERRIDLNLFHWSFYRCCGRVWRGEWGL